MLIRVSRLTEIYRLTVKVSETDILKRGLQDLESSREGLLSTLWNGLSRYNFEYSAEVIGLIGLQKNDWVRCDWSLHTGLLIRKKFKRVFESFASAFGLAQISPVCSKLTFQVSKSVSILVIKRWHVDMINQSFFPPSQLCSWNSHGIVGQMH